MTPEQRLAAAEQAYHDLQTGEKVRVIVDQNGERIEYQSANRADLYTYIQQLRRDLTPGGLVGVPQPIKFIF